MIYEVGMLCKHFKGSNLLEKNIYRIEALGVDGKSIDDSLITYTGDNELQSATNLVVYSNIFQNNKMFCREYEDISQELSEEKQSLYNQLIKVQPLSIEEEEYIKNQEFIEEKKQLVLTKFSK